MKKILCIGLVLLLFISVPIKGYSAAPVVYGIGEEIVLPFILALLGVQAASSVDSYTDLKDYHDEVYSTLIENLSGLASIDTVRSWLFSAAQGLINTNSVVWEKLYEFAMSQYTVSSGGTVVNPDNPLNVPSFPFTYASSLDVYSSEFGRSVASANNINAVVVWQDTDTGYRSFNVMRASYTNQSGYIAYTYDGKTVYYNQSGHTGNFGTLTVTPSSALFTGANIVPGMNYNNRGAYAWSMLYDAISTSPNDAIYSDAFDNVLTSAEKDDIIDGTSVVQLYNPAALQNGLEIIPGGDPDEDPNLKKIPFAVTADWWNFFQQFGEQSGNTYVNAYNALNGIGENVTTGLISKAYDALGIASIAGSAANAAQGIISLTDTNIYPASQTAADAITNTIPSGLTPEAPDSGIDNDSDQGLYKLPDLRDYFPFCIPFDLIDFLSCFAAEPETPHFIIALSDGEHLAQENIDLEVFNNIAAMVRTFELAIFVVGLILITRNLIRG